MGLYSELAVYAVAALWRLTRIERARERVSKACARGGCSAEDAELRLIKCLAGHLGGAKPVARMRERVRLRSAWVRVA